MISSSIIRPAPHCAPSTMLGQTHHIEAAARLHLGFLDPGGRSGRRYGGIGLALERPRWRVSLKQASQFSITGTDDPLLRQRIRQLFGHPAPPLACHLYSHIPFHRGLGAGTQLALALGTAQRLLGAQDCEPMAVAIEHKRGQRSGIGIHCFHQGGLVVDGGIGKEGLPPPLISRCHFPQEWRLLLISDPHMQGLHGASEEQFFAKKKDFPASLTARLSQLVLLQLLPGLAEKNWLSVSDAIGEIQRVNGDFFAVSQGGWVRSPRVAKALGCATAAGFSGIGQSSWGPTGFVLTQGNQQATELRRRLHKSLGTTALEYCIVQVRNQGYSHFINP